MIGMKNFKNNGGFALMMTIWIVVFLSVVAMSFTFSSRFSTAMTRNFKEGTIAYASALSGYHEVLEYLSSDKDAAVDFVDENGRFYLERDSEPVPEVIPFDGAEVKVFVSDAAGKINLNFAGDDILNKIFNHLGLEPDVKRELIDSLKDWVDPDDAHRLNGAEDEYYQEFGYVAKNDKLDVIDELILVKGFTREMLYGSRDFVPLASLVTTFGSGGVNINTASSEVMRLLGVAEMDIESVMRQRTQTIAGYGFIPAQFTTLGFSRTASTFLNVEVQGSPDDSNIIHYIKAVVKRVPAGKGYRIEPLYWRENVSYNRSQS
jgi:general secretion pathway protein K